MLIEYRLPRPTAGAIEFRDDMLSVLEAYVIHAVLEGIQGETMSGGDEVRGFDSLQDTLRREAEKELA